MLFLIFQVGGDWYALDTAHVVEVLPQVVWKKLPLSPPGIAGVLNYHGDPVPLVDLTELLLGIPARRQMSTRIILANYADRTGATHLLGLVAEQATETIRRERSDFVDAGASSDRAPFLGPVAKDKRGLIQLIEPRTLLSQSVCDALFRQPVEVER
jgi:chemotaxis-related protein WspB